MMKKLYLGLLSVLFGVVLGLSFVKGDIIDPGGWESEGHGFGDVVENDTGSEVQMKDRQVKFYENFYYGLSDVEGYIWDVVIFLLIYFILSTIPLCFVFKKMGEKWWKVNIYHLFKTVGIRELFYWLIYVFFVN